MELTHEQIWFLAGAILLSLEFLVASNIGFIFVGLGALTLGFLMSFGVVESVLWQWIVFLGSSLAWAGLLWKRMRNWQQNKNPKPYKDMIGQSAVLLSALKQGEQGEAKWSGVTMKARLHPEAASPAKEGAEVEIVEIQGNMLIVK